jgi:hypothetical protein
MSAEYYELYGTHTTSLKTELVPEVNDEADLLLNLHDERDLDKPIDRRKLRSDPDYTGCIPQPRDQAAGLTIDFSRWDHSITVADRMIEADFVQQFYREKYQAAIDNACREMSFHICVNDFGDVWARIGQRGSGETLTSIGNTFLVVCHLVTALVMLTDMSVKEATETIGHIDYFIKGPKEDACAEYMASLKEQSSCKSPNDLYTLYGGIKKYLAIKRYEIMRIFFLLTVMMSS